VYEMADDGGGLMRIGKIFTAGRFQCIYLFLGGEKLTLDWGVDHRGEQAKD
jgi:hypothetical protein